ncbi:hypothetical protein VZO05_00875 [Aggregatilineales bacterium SYSU G02658]
MSRLWFLMAALLMAACAPQPPPPVATATPTAPPLLPIDPTSTPDLATDEPTFTPAPNEPLPTLDVPTQPSPTTQPTTAAPTQMTPTEAAALQPMVSFDATPTQEVIAAQTAPSPTAAPLTPITTEVWRSVRPAESSAIFSGADLLGGTLTVPYPTGWQSSGDANGLILANTDEVNITTSDLASGQAAIFITVIPNDLAPLAVAEGFEPSAPLILANFIAQADTSVQNATWGQVLLTRAGTRPAAIVSGSNGDDDALIVSVALEKGYALITTVADRGELSVALPTVALIARELTYQR